MWIWTNFEASDHEEDELWLTAFVILVNTWTGSDVIYIIWQFHSQKQADDQSSRGLCMESKDKLTSKQVNSGLNNTTWRN